MIIVSSFRPEENCPEEIMDQQLAANRSWVKLLHESDRIFYFNHGDRRFSSTKTVFVPTDGKPTIKQMVALCGGLNDWSAIVNADIVLTQNFRRVEDAMRGRPCACVISRRYTLPRNGDTSAAVLAAGDNGLDFFAATPSVWAKAASLIPDDFKLGRIVWDNWMLNFFMGEFGNYCYDITPSRCVFHPQHDYRTDQNWDFPKDDPYLKKNNWPFHSIEY